jgi:pSer/pThr/pTyr-binding forkhead associated (FHA) protein
MEAVATINGKPLVIGRANDNDLILKNMPSVSRRHAEIYQLAGLVYIEDLNSTNGTYVNGQRISGPVALKNGDRILLGGFTCEYVTDSHSSNRSKPDADSANSGTDKFKSVIFLSERARRAL